MEELVINGGKKLGGELVVHGAKNSVLPILSATILCKGKTVLYNCPKLTDVDCAVQILKSVGCKIKRYDDIIEIESSGINNSKISKELMQTMRSSIIFLGALLARTSCATLTFPGGCELGPRPIDIHLNSLKRLGVLIDERFGTLNCKANGKMCGASINLPFPSVGATENVVLAAVLAKGTTRIYNCAREPEIVDLADFLNKCGAKIMGAGRDTIVIDGVDELHGCEHKIIPDRIEVATYLAVAGATSSELIITNVKQEHIEPVIFAFRETGCEIFYDSQSESIKVIPPKRLNRIKQIRTLTYPGFPTDAQPPVMAMSAVANGTSMFIETIFQNRYKHINELVKMGANIKTEERVAIVEGVEKLYGAEVSATDLRGGAALIVAALSANGKTRIDEIHHIDRGYEKIEDNLRKAGADIHREVV